MISIVDFGIGNLGSVSNMLNYIGAPNKIISSSDEILAATKLILPGVGNWDHGSTKIQQSGLKSALDEAVLISRVPILGICLGMQLLTERSEEGILPGLGWIPGSVVKFRSAVTKKGLRIPHMGWNMVRVVKQSALTDQLAEDARFYFVHSYHMECNDSDDVLMVASHGYEFTCAVQRDNIWGVQFHPEKSHKFGVEFMKLFSEI